MTVSFVTDRTTAPPSARPLAEARLPAIDVLRGIVMVLMTIDHASEALNRGRFFADSARSWKPGAVLPAAQFMTRWITHLCAPTFVFLAGVSLAIAVEARRAKGDTERAIDRYILARGAIIVALELTWMSFVMHGPGKALLQVLYAIGASLICMALLRRLSDVALGVSALLVLALDEVVIDALRTAGVERTIGAALLLVPGAFYGGRLIVAYPLLPWLAIMMLGWMVGRRFMLGGRGIARPSARSSVPRALSIAGAALLALFVVLRGIDGYGNMRLHRDDGSLVHWLHVSKYPPSLTFVGLELGLALLALAGLFVVTRKRPNFGGPLELFGQVALFYYLLHIHLLHLAAWALGVDGKLGLASAYVGAAITLAALYPACLAYRAYKAKHKTSFVRFL